MGGERRKRKVDGGLHNLVAEAQVLACCMLDEGGEFVARAVMAGVTGEAFYGSFHRWIWRVMSQLAAAGMPVDSMAVALAMRSEDGDRFAPLELDEVANAVRTSMGFKQALAEVLHLWRARQAQRAVAELAERFADAGGDWPGFYEVLQQKAGELAGLRPQEEEDTPAKVVARSREILRRKIEGREDKSRWIYSGLSNFDDKMGALDWQSEDWLVILAAAPSSGKSAAARSCFVNTSLERGLRVAAFTLETSCGMYLRSLASTRANVNLRQLGELPKDMEERMEAEHELVGKYLTGGQLWLWDDVYLLETIKMRAREVKRATGDLHLVVVDYLQMVQVGNEALKRAPREQVVAHISRELKLLGKEIGCPVLAAAQLNREMRKGETKRRPRTSDLRESGAIEQDADCIMTLFVPDEDCRGARQTDDQMRVEVELSVLKRRNGPLGLTKLWFDRPWMRFTPMRDEEMRRNGVWDEDPEAAPDEELPKPGQRRR